ncbi:MAG: SRPBCC family protein [Phycisphaerales bacterium]|nr:SRPBCC family protein [Phycisphaerales bacterium]MCB9856151.1 SRPBCC family protein [Phycisphaerales bacterium]
MGMWIAAAAGALILTTILIVVFVGRSLPKDFSATTSLKINRTPQDVWTAIGDFKKLPVSAKMCKGTEPLADVANQPAWRENIGSSRIRVETLEADAPKRLVRQCQDEVVPMRMRVEYDIESREQGCAVTCTTNGRIDDGTWHAPLFRFMIHKFGGVKSGQKQYLALLARQLGQEPNID